MKNPTHISIAVILSLGVAACGYFVGDGIRFLKTNDRYVDVRGLAEKNVQADTAELVIKFTNGDNVRTALFPKMASAQEKIIAELRRVGLKESEIQPGQWSTTRVYRSDSIADASIPAFESNSAIKIKTHNILAIEKAMTTLNALQISTEGAISGSEVSYSFNGISALRAEMIAAATKDARHAALQFAADSGSQVGSISNASQGVFQILAPGRDEDDATSVNKTVRVVTSVTYELRD